MACKYPIYIPSKGRSGNSKTVSQLEEAGMSFSIVVEPQDYESYKEAYPDAVLVQLPKDNGGISYVRTFCKTHSAELGAERHWQLDDNINAFYKMENGKRITVTPAAALVDTENFIDRYSNVAIAGLMSTAYGFGVQVPFKKNQQVYCCVLVLNSTDFIWRMRTTGEDTDYCLQVLSAGWCTILMQIYQIGKATTGSTKGGLQDHYKDDGRIQRVRELQRLWGKNLIGIHNKYGRPQQDLRHVWRKFDTPLEKVNA